MTSSIRTAPWRTCQCLARQSLRAPPSARYISTTNCLRSAKHGATNPLRSRPAGSPKGEDVKYRRSIVWSAAGIVASAAAMYGVIKLDLFGLEELEAGKNGKSASKPHEATIAPSESRAMKMDGPPGFPSDGGPSVIPLHGQDNVDQIATGNSSVPYFPTTIRLPSITGTENKKPGDKLSTSDGDEYQLLGLGIRTVSFLSIQVYVVGIDPPPVSDEAAAISGVGAEAATSLVPPERQQLRDLLMDPEHGDAAWTALIKENGIRTAFRIVPTRNTDFLHLRDAWVRGITARAQQLKASGSESQDMAFGSAINEFKAIVGGGQAKNIPKGQTVVLLRDAHGALDALFQPDPKATHWMGRVSDERISRFVWLNYLAGKKVSSEGARKSIVDGLMTVVERPVGTVAQRVV
ncbi:Chalcone isomerase [Penicillium longicatenatum]|nr:Chalcone isomerase [Penicillium longicatenatum]